MQRDEISLWRGRFIEEYALAESAVSEALAALASKASEGRKSLLPHLTGQRFEALRIVTGIGGPIEQRGQRIAEILNEFEGFHRIRSFICHGRSSITVYNSDEWCLNLDLLSFLGTKIERFSMQLTSQEAAITLERLRSARIRLDGQLKGLLSAFSNS